MVKMRTNGSPDAKCVGCNNGQKQSLGLFDVKIGSSKANSIQFTICDQCNNILFSKTLSVSCKVNGRVKDKDDLKLINSRKMMEENKWLK